VRESDAAHGYVHTCVAYPLSDLRLRVQPGISLL
jgi:hypothetical protein